MDLSVCKYQPSPVQLCAMFFFLPCLCFMKINFKTHKMKLHQYSLCMFFSSVFARQMYFFTRCLSYFILGSFGVFFLCRCRCCCRLLFVSYDVRNLNHFPTLPNDIHNFFKRIYVAQQRKEEKKKLISQYFERNNVYNVQTEYKIVGG